MSKNKNFEVEKELETMEAEIVEEIPEEEENEEPKKSKRDLFLKVGIGAVIIGTIAGIVFNSRRAHDEALLELMDSYDKDEDDTDGDGGETEESSEDEN